MEMKMSLKCSTKTCYRFEYREKDKFTTLYLKKTDVADAGINPENGIIITVKEDKTNA